VASALVAAGWLSIVTCGVDTAFSADTELSEAGVVGSVLVLCVPFSSGEAAGASLVPCVGALAAASDSLSVLAPGTEVFGRSALVKNERQSKAAGGRDVTKTPPRRLESRLSPWGTAIECHLRGPPASEPYIVRHPVTLIWISGPRGCA
jgi:hypothetical protein